MGMKQAKRAGMALALAAVAVVGVSAAATAAPTGCASGRLCMWRDAGYETAGVATNEIWFEFKYSDFRYRYYTGTQDAHDNGSSIYNNGVYDGVWMYTNVNYGGASFYLAKASGDGNLSTGTSPVPAGFNDELDSGCFVNDCP
jgi:hypothetical protein